MINFLNDINCILLHWQKKTTLVLMSIFVHFLEELKTPKSPFEINWPLEIVWNDCEMTWKLILQQNF